MDHQHDRWTNTALDGKLDAKLQGLDPLGPGTTQSKNWRVCSNAKCKDVFWDARYTLCPSCRYIGQVGFYMGAVLAGACYVLWQVVQWLAR
jgi:hypothetical protein